MQDAAGQRLIDYPTFTRSKPALTIPGFVYNICRLLVEQFHQSQGCDRNLIILVLDSRRTK